MRSTFTRKPARWKVIVEAERLEQENPVQADTAYRQGIEAFPDAAPLLSSYAIFLQQIRKDITSGVRSPGWDFSPNIERARVERHLDADWLSKLAAVISDGPSPAMLDDWPAWLASQPV